jgi:dTDP-4-dehydrorhamnose reductase
MLPLLDSSYQGLIHSKPILVFGRDGQIGRALQVFLQSVRVPVVFLGRSDCDLSNEKALIKVLDNHQPKFIINAAAYTSVEGAESESDLAFAINAKAPHVMAQYIAHVPDGVLIHYSTDYVFGDTQQKSYLETDPVGPMEQLSVYGQSKLAGEELIQKVFLFQQYSSQAVDANSFSRYFILRTSWVYGEGDNFIRTILHRAIKLDVLRVVANQFGVPTSAVWLAELAAILCLSEVESGIYHAVPDGEVSWHELALFLVEEASLMGWPIKVDIRNVLSIQAKAALLKARRPYNSKMNNAKLKQLLSILAPSKTYPAWQDQVKSYIAAYTSTTIAADD